MPCSHISQIDVIEPRKLYLTLYWDTDSPSNHLWRLVNLAEGTCQCQLWFDNQKPCIHAIACMNFACINPVSSHHKVYYVSTFKALYDSVLVPLPPHNLTRDIAARAPTSCASNITVNKRGPKSNKRKKSKGMRN